MGEISGFGNGYESCCQDMLEAGVNHLNEHPDSDPHYKGFKGIYGVILEDNPDAKALTKAVIDAAKGDATGIMHQAVISRLLQIKKHGWDWYCLECRKHEATQGTEDQSKPA